MTHQAVPDFNSEVLTNLDSNDSNQVVLALLSTVIYGGSYDLAVLSTSRFLEHGDIYIRGTAVECISHIARQWRKVPIDFLSQATIALSDSDEWVSSKADYTIDDLEVFIQDYKRPKAL